MNRSTFIVGAAALFTAVFVAIFVTFQADDPSGATGQSTLADKSSMEAGSGAGRSWVSASPAENDTPTGRIPASEQRLLDTLREQAAANRGRGGTISTTVTAAPFSVSVSPSLLKEASPSERVQLMQIAQEIEAQALDELQLLSDQFDLTDAQKVRIFPLLVQAAPGFSPGIDIGGIGTVDAAEPSTGATVAEADALESTDSVEDAIFNELDPDQQEEMIEVAIDNQNWWSEIVGQLEDDLDSAIGEPIVLTLEEGDGSPQGPTQEEPVRNSTTPVQFDETGQPIDAEPELHQGGNIFDRVLE